MLALAPPLQAHSPAHTVANLKVASRSKTVPRRVQTSYATSSTPTSSATPSASSSSSFSATAAPVAPASLSTHARTRSNIAQQQRHEAHSVPEPSSSRPAPPPQPHQPSYLSVAATLERDASPAVVTPTRSSSTIDIHTYPTTDLLRHLAALLTRIATANDSLAPPLSLDPSSSLAPHTSLISDTPACRTLFTASRTALSSSTSPTAFHARNVPTISLEAYLLRVLRYCPTTNEVFLSLLVYFDRMSKLSQEATGNRFAIDSHNVHRLVIAGVTVASKFFSDVFYTNSRYAKVGGLPQSELNQLELQFLLLNDFRLVIPAEEIERYAEQLMGFAAEQAPGGAPPSTASSGAPSGLVAPAPSRPLVSMGAIDAYGGDASHVSSATSSDPRNGMATPKRTASSAPPPSATPDDSFERESSVYSETDTDAETDDEPTIRPAHSSASSETQSLYSNDASEDADDDDGDDDDNREEERRGRQRTHRWQTTSVDRDRRMASP